METMFPRVDVCGCEVTFNEYEEVELATLASTVGGDSTRRAAKIAQGTSVARGSNLRSQGQESSPEVSSQEFVESGSPKAGGFRLDPNALPPFSVNISTR